MTKVTGFSKDVLLFQSSSRSIRDQPHLALALTVTIDLLRNCFVRRMLLQPSHIHMRIEDIYFTVVDKNEQLTETFKDKLSILKDYSVSEDINYSRSMAFLDSCRDEYNIDDVLVHIIKANFEVEACWIRIELLKNHSFIGTLLNEPYQDLGVHQGELVEFRVEKTSEDKYLCCCYLEN